MRWIGIVFGCLVYVSVSASLYEQRFTASGGKAYMEDTNVWVYTAEFAERFSMPEAWIDEGLTGAYAAAFRVETFDARLMLPHKGPDVGIANRFCILDLYLPANAELPWNTDELHGGTHITPISRAYLSPRREEDKKRNLSEVGISKTGKQARRPLIYFGRGVNGGGSLSLIKFERDIYPGLDYLSFSAGCMTPPDTKSWVEFRRDQEWTTDDYVTLHRVELPTAFMEKLYATWQLRSRTPASKAFQDVLKK